MRKAALFAIAFAVAGCGGANGKLNGKLSISGMMAPAVNNITVTAIGPTGGGALTDSSGNFEIDNLADGNYSVSAVVPGTVEGEVRVFANVKGGKGTAPELKFSMPPPPPAPKAGTVTGKVAYSDGSDASTITVTLTGPSSTGAAAAVDGTFTFADLTPGLYTLSFDAADTLEKRSTVAVSVTDGMTTTVPPVTLTAIGTVTGKATKGAAAGNAGITVTVAGTPYRAFTADDGSYTLTGVPAGMQTLVASLPDWDPVTAMVTVARGSNAAPDLQLSKLTPHGTVSGTVIFTDQQDRSIITVRAQGTSLTTSCDVNGHYTLALPAGHFHLVADAPYFPSRDLGQVAVDDGTTVQLPLVAMSPWIDLGPEPGVTGSPLFVPTADGDHALYVLNFGGTLQYRMYDFATNSVHIFFNGSLPNQAISLSPHGHYFAVFIGSAWVVLDTQTAAFNAFPVSSAPPGGSNAQTFTHDEKYFIVQDTNQVHRFEIATAIDSPLTGKASVDFQNDGFLLQDVASPPWILSYFTATGAATQVATGVSKYIPFVSGQTVIWNNCNGNCGISLLDQATGMLKTTSAALPTTTGAFSANGSAAWIDFNTSSGGGGFMNVATQAFTVKPLNFVSYVFNPSGASVLYEIFGTGYTLHLESGAPTGGGTIVGTDTNPFGPAIGGSTAWLDDKRAIAFGSSPLVRYDIVNGTVTQDTDVVMFTGTAAPRVAQWQRSSDKKWAFADREFNDLIIDYGSTGNPNGVCETRDQGYLIVGGTNVAATATYNTVIRNNSTSAITDKPGFIAADFSTCSGPNSSLAQRLDGVQEYLTPSGQTIEFTFGHFFSYDVISQSSGLTLAIGELQVTPTQFFPSVMVHP